MRWERGGAVALGRDELTELFALDTMPTPPPLLPIQWRYVLLDAAHSLLIPIHLNSSKLGKLKSTHNPIKNSCFVYQQKARCFRAIELRRLKGTKREEVWIGEGRIME